LEEGVKRERERESDQARGLHSEPRSLGDSAAITLDANCRYAEALHKRNYCIRESFFWRTARARDPPQGLRTSATAALLQDR